MKGAGPSNMNTTNLSIVTLCALSSARGGECNFLKTADWSFYRYLGVLNTPWPGVKIVKYYEMPRLPRPDWFSDFCFCLGLYAMCKDGLPRSEDHISKGLRTNLFQGLHHINDAEGLHSLTYYEGDIETFTCLRNALNSVGGDNVQSLFLMKLTLVSLELQTQLLQKPLIFLIC